MPTQMGRRYRELSVHKWLGTTTSSRSCRSCSTPVAGLKFKVELASSIMRSGCRNALKAAIANEMGSQANQAVVQSPDLQMSTAFLRPMTSFHKG